MKALVDLALSKSGCEKRYLRRIISNPILAELGCLPQTLTQISNQEPPWFCHGLAFRMATYSDACDDLFGRWEIMLSRPRNAHGWQNEYAHWSNAADHWAKKWDKFHQFLWLLQCYEYFSQRGLDVSFPASNQDAMPDLLIKRQGQEELYAECYFYSKWWPREEYFEHLLCKIDENLRIKRTYNVGHNASGNPFCSDDQFFIALGHLETALQSDKLAELRVAAQKAYPQRVCEVGDFAILLEGAGEYQPSDNAHGDPAYSLPVYLNEIISAKKNSNNLNGSRPNMVMANGLGLDYQFSLADIPAHGPPTAELPCSIDEMWFFACGIDENLKDCRRARKILREGYAGSGF